MTDIHPNEVSYLKKKVEGMAALMAKMEARIAKLEEDNMTLYTTVRSLDRKAAVQTEVEAPSKKRKTPLTAPKSENKKSLQPPVSDKTSEGVVKTILNEEEGE